MPTARLAITGLGLIGGSLARDLAADGFEVLGYDPDPETLQAALDEGVIAGTIGPDLEGVEGAEILIIAAPVGRAPGVLTRAADRLRGLRLITDVGSTKGRITRAATLAGLEETFVGGHPLAGDHRAGWLASRRGLFQDARVFLTPTIGTGNEAVQAAHELWGSVGAEVEVVDADTHDREIAWASHLPQVTSTALALALEHAGISRDQLGPGGRDLTRLAGSSPTIWTEIALENAEPIIDAIAELQGHLQSLRGALQRRDARAISQFFADGRAWSARRGRGPTDQ